LPIPVAESTPPKNAPAPTTSKIIATGRNAAAESSLSSLPVSPRRVPSSQDASSTEMVSATAGVPANAAIPERVECFGSQMLPKVPARISTSGTAMIPATSPSDGRSASSPASSATSMSSGTGTLIRLPIQDDQHDERFDLEPDDHC
jgi:hypothetical protein